MPIPDYQSLMLPLLECAADNNHYSVKEVVPQLGNLFNLTSQELSELLPSRTQPVFENRVGWAKTYLKKAGLLHYPKRGFFQITPLGREVLQQNPTTIDNQFLAQFPEFQEFRRRKKDGHGDDTETQGSTATPEEILEATYEEIRNDLADELLTQIKQVEPSYFEKIVVDLLVKMGYGGSIRDAGKALGRSGDEGIDGIIKEDKLGLDVIYLQAKRWEGVVSRPEIQKFAGALAGQRARKGIFITTSRFSSEAHEYVARIEPKIVLIDGEQLAELMIDHGLGVSVEAVYEVKRIDSDYFLG